MIIQRRNVNGLWQAALLEMEQSGIEQDSRAGRVRVAPQPVMSVYEKPTERVLFDPVRDANPFFHLMESLWMLAGRSDAAFLNHYVKDFGDRFADGGYIHGAYGFRWRVAFGFDQLEFVVAKLRKNPSDRQAVIQMWDADRRDDLMGDWKDRPCNTHVYLRVSDSKLDLTVCCRSNDIVWGAYGANAVHFSVLQEYLAGRIGVGVGKLYQFSNNWHGYVAVLDKYKHGGGIDPYALGHIIPEPIGYLWDEWDADLVNFMRWHGRQWAGERHPEVTEYANQWFARTAVPVALANWSRQTGDTQHAIRLANTIDAPDWRMACVRWLQRRMK